MYWIKRKYLHLFCIILIALLGIKLLYPLEHYMDLIFGDEATYLYIGNELFNTVDLSFGPLYALYYKIYLLFTDDKIFVYYLNFKILSIITPILLYCLLVRLKFAWQMALFIALSFLVSSINITCWPKISHFTIAVIMLVIIASTYIQNRFYKVLLFTIGTFIIAYARPEFFLLFYLLIIWCIYLLVKSATKKHLLYFSLIAVFFVLVFATLGYPSKDVVIEYGVVIKRSFVAVVQHYFLSQQMRGIKHDFYFLSVYDYYYNGLFKASNGTILGLFTHYFPLMLKHIIINVGFYLLQLTTKLASLFNPFFIKIGKKFILSSLLIFIGLIFSAYKNKAFKHWLKLFYKGAKYELIFILLFMIPTIISCLLIMPREHYIVLQILSIAIITAVLLQAVFIKYKYISYVMLIATVCICFTRTLQKYTFVQVDTDNKNVSLNLIKDLQAIATKKDSLYIFTDLLNSTVFITNADEPKTIEYSINYYKYKNFKSYLAHKPYNIIIYNKTMEQEPILRNDTTWHQFLNQPELLNFKEYRNKNLGSTYRVFVKE